MKRLLVLGAGLLQTPVINKAKELGCYVIAADGNSRAQGLNIADKSIVANITSGPEMLRIAIQEKIDGIIHPCSEVAMSVMGYINDELNLSGISKKVAERATNKYLMRKAFEEYGAPSPIYIMTESCEHAWQVFRKILRDNAILKPSRNSGSRGIARVDKRVSRDEFEILYNRAYEESRDRSVLIEEFIEGPEFSVEIIVWKNEVHVLAVTDKKTTGAPYFVEVGHNQPSVYPSEIIEKVKVAAIKGVNALELNNCAAHAEIKVQNNRAYLMEIGARLGGDFISTELVHLSTGIDMVAAAISVALGQEPDLSSRKDCYGACIRYFTPNAGVVREITNIHMLSNPHIYSSEIYIKEGEVINELKSSLDRSGHVIVCHDTVQEAIELADNIINVVNFNS